MIGAQRSASTFLNTCLRNHPDVYSPDGEVEYFEDPHYEARGQQYLVHLFDKAPRAQVYGFKRPELLARPECPGRIAADLPGVRLIAVLRNPIERTVSAYYHYASLRAIPLLPLNEGIQRILNGDLQGRYPMAEQIMDYSLYGSQLSRYRRFFGEESILVLFDEEVTKDTRTVLPTVFEFVGVDPREGGSPQRRTVNAGVSSTTRLRFHRMVSPLAYGFKPEVSAIRENRVAVAAHKSLITFDRALLRRVCKDGRPALETHVRARLVELFRPDVEELRRVLGAIPKEWAELLPGGEQ